MRTERGFAPLLVILVVVGVIVLGLTVSRSPNFLDKLWGVPTVKTVSSADGNFKVEIPKGALPDGVEVTVEQLADKLPDTPFDTPWIGPVYKLGPSGLKFDKPVTVTVRLSIKQSLNEGEIGLITPWIIDDNQIARPLDGESGQKVEDDGTITVVSKVSHFSILGYVLSPVVQGDAVLRLRPYNEKSIRGDFKDGEQDNRKFSQWPIDETGTGNLYFTFTSVLSTSGWFGGLDSPDVTWGADGTYLKTARGDFERLDPKIVDDVGEGNKPPPRRLKYYWAEAMHPFYCVEAGIGKMRATVSFRIFWDNVDQTKEPYFSDHWMNIVTGIECMDVPKEDDWLFSRESKETVNVYTKPTPSANTNKKSEYGLFRFKFTPEAYSSSDLKLIAYAFKNYEIKKIGPNLPIKVELKIGGNLVWTTIISANDCNDDVLIPYCQVKGYNYSTAWKGKVLELVAYNKNNSRISSYTADPNPINK